jgi:hypothetical protein
MIDIMNKSVSDIGGLAAAGGAGAGKAGKAGAATAAGPFVGFPGIFLIRWAASKKRESNGGFVSSVFFWACGCYMSMRIESGSLIVARTAALAHTPILVAFKSK